MYGPPLSYLPGTPLGTASKNPPEVSEPETLQFRVLGGFRV